MLTGKNIVLRPRTPDDAELFSRWHSDPEFGGYFVSLPPRTPEQMANSIRQDGSNVEDASYVIRRRETDEPVGVAMNYPISHLPWAHGLEIGYVVHPQFRRKGIAREATCLLINHLFDAVPVDRIQATVTVGNEISCRVLERAGMQREGIMRAAVFLHGRRRDKYLYAITREDWGDEERYRAEHAEF